MSSRRPLLRLLAIAPAAAALLLAAPALKAEYLELYTTSRTNLKAFDKSTTTVSYTLRMTGLGRNVISAYDIGIIYNPALITLQSFAFDAGNLLGDPSLHDGEDATEVLQIDHLDNTNDPIPLEGTEDANSTWDYRDNSNSQNPPDTGQTYSPAGGADPDLGTPDITAANVINEGSLRFASASYLDIGALQILQGLSQENPFGNEITPLLHVVFEVDLDAPGRTPIEIVYSTDYDPADEDVLDIKYNGGTFAQYPERISGEIVVAAPAPASWLLLLPGLALLGSRRPCPR